MKILLSILIIFSFYSFHPSTEKIETNLRNGFYITIEDHENRSFKKYIIESKDSANNIFNRCFDNELELGDVDKPISIFNGDMSFYIARVTVYEKANGKKNFRHFKYPIEKNKRGKLKTVIL